MAPNPQLDTNARAVAAIGNFDGVHLGHREILSAVVAEARQRNARALAITFDPHPEAFLRPSAAPRLITPMSERIALIRQTGIDEVVILSFDAELAKLSARAFVQTILVDRLNICALHEGSNFRFGHRAEAGIEQLAVFGKEFGFDLCIHPALHVRGFEVSSSAIRDRIATGDIRRARWMLGHPFRIVSTQKRDRGIGTELLVPTVNMAPYEDLLPSHGVYVTRMKIAGHTFQSVTNIGTRPTFEGAGFSVETHILNFQPIEMDATTPIELEFLMRLRDEMIWPTPEALKAQIMKDVSRAKKLFARLREP